MPKAIFVQNIGTTAMMFFDTDTKTIPSQGGYVAYKEEDGNRLYKEFSPKASDIWDVNEACRYITQRGGEIPPRTDDILDDCQNIIQAIFDVTYSDAETPDDGA